NILIHREASYITKGSIGNLFRWLDDLHYQKCIHPHSLEEIKKHADERVVATFQAKLSSYHTLKTLAPTSPTIESIRTKYDTTENDAIEPKLLKEVDA